MPSLQRCDWETLYRGWDDAAYKYYWRDLDLEVVPFDLTPFDRRDTRAIELGFAGDLKARSALIGVVDRHRDPALRARAAGGACPSRCRRREKASQARPDRLTGHTGSR